MTQFSVSTSSESNCPSLFTLLSWSFLIVSLILYFSIASLLIDYNWRSTYKVPLTYPLIWLSSTSIYLSRIGIISDLCFSKVIIDYFFTAKFMIKPIKYCIDASCNDSVSFRNILKIIGIIPKEIITNWDCLM
jgi:hypothetical protein